MNENPASAASRIATCLLVAGCLFAWPALLTFSPGDWPSPVQFPHNSPPANWCGQAGAATAYVLHHGLGRGAYALLLYLTLAAFVRLAGADMRGWGQRIFGLALILPAACAAAHMLTEPLSAPLPQGHGGVLGFTLGEFMLERFSRLGSFVILAASLAVGLIFATESWISPLLAVVNRGREAARSAARQLGLGSEEGGRTLATLALGRSSAAGGKTHSALVKKPVKAFQVADDEEEAGLLKFEPKINASRKAGPTTSAVEEEEEEELEEFEDGEETAEVGEEEESERPAVGMLESVRAALTRSSPPVRLSRPRPSPEAQSAYPRKIENWSLPELSLLDEPEEGFSEIQESVVREKAKVLEKTLEEFRLDAPVVAIETGPVITLFELQLAAGIKVAQISSLANDIARALKAPAIRIVSPMPGKNTVGVEVPNVDKEKVRIKELILLAGEKARLMSLPLFIGKDAGGAVLAMDLTRAPHMLIAGTTGSGKSVCLNSIIVSLLLLKAPDQVKLILVDPKMVEMSQFKDVPHLMCPIITDMERAEKILEWAVTKMDERYELLAEAQVRHIAAYNSLGEEELFRRFRPENEGEKRAIPLQLPFIVIVIDELADMMMTAAKEVEHHLSRLAQKSRAVGIHIVVATQRPEAKVVTGLIKSNLPSRIAFRVASRMDSRIVLDQNGAEVLMGQGDMLYLPPGSHKLVRAQGTYLEDAEVHRIIDDLTTKARPEFHPELMRIRSSDPTSILERDPLFDQAVRIVLESKRGSVSLLQRRLTIGYSRASRLIEQMSDAGIIGSFKGSQAREVTMTVAEWDSLKNQVEEDLKAGYDADKDESPLED